MTEYDDYYRHWLGAISDAGERGLQQTSYAAGNYGAIPTATAAKLIREGLAHKNPLYRVCITEAGRLRLQQLQEPAVELHTPKDTR
jgi:hypothetical protein